ncbi:MAG: MutT [Haloplasmataceae bacterium]|jgi:tRNA nucleotidyltransferase (CCA-adding enzyme)|nr:MutT [Haloplasmataceae bacterium]
MLQEKSCGAVVYKKENNEYLFLIIKSKAFDFYGFPKGHVEHNETEVETALREVLEETNIKITIIKNFKEIIEYSPAKDTKKIVIYFLGEALNHDVFIQIEEISESIWLNYSDAYKTLTYDNEKKLLKSAYNYLLK